MRVIFTCLKSDTPAQTFLPGANWQDFMFLQLFWHRRGFRFCLFCRTSMTSGARSSVVRQLLSVVQGSQTILKLMSIAVISVPLDWEHSLSAVVITNLKQCSKKWCYPIISIICTAECSSYSLILPCSFCISVELVYTDLVNKKEMIPVLVPVRCIHVLKWYTVELQYKNNLVGTKRMRVLYIQVVLLHLYFVHLHITLYIHICKTSFCICSR